MHKGVVLGILKWTSAPCRFATINTIFGNGAASVTTDGAVQCGIVGVTTVAAISDDECAAESIAGEPGVTSTAKEKCRGPATWSGLSHAASSSTCGSVPDTWGLRPDAKRGKVPILAREACVAEHECACIPGLASETCDVCVAVHKCARAAKLEVGACAAEVGLPMPLQLPLP